MNNSFIKEAGSHEEFNMITSNVNLAKSHNYCKNQVKCPLKLKYEN